LLKIRDKIRRTTNVVISYKPRQQAAHRASFWLSMLARAALFVLTLPAATLLHPLPRRLGRPLLCAPANIRVRVVEPSDLTQLAQLSTSALYGEVDIWKDGPIAVAQRRQILQEQRKALARRIDLEGDAESLFLVAMEPSKYGERVCGCLDLAVHLFDAEERRFELERDAMPAAATADRYRWAPYMASVAVAAADRRGGIGRQMVQTAEAWAERNGYTEMMLEVSERNEAAIEFHERGGYSTFATFAEGEAGGGGEVVVRRGVQWVVEQTGKHVMRKELGES
jgi:GNAT superfamily N-acetyltransferase